MHLFSNFQFALPLLASAAIPQLADRATNNFHLQAKVRDATNPHFDGLFLSYYHTGAGFADPTFDKTGELVFLNSTSKQLQYNLDEEYPTSLFLGADTNYAGWEFATIQGGSPNKKYSQFYFNSTGLQWTSDHAKPTFNEWNGWMLCDWWHNAPQLFWLYSYYNYPLPTSCSRVDLIPVYK